MSALRAKVRELVTEFLCEEIVERIDPPDLFNIENACPFNPAGHHPIASCGDVVCPDCGKVFWQ